MIEKRKKEFMAFFALDLYPEIDFEQGVDFKNLELFQLVMKSKKGTKYSDKIVKVHLKNREEKYIFIHIEVQAVGKKEFAERMFKYFYGTKLTYAYNTYRFYEKDPEELKKLDNPFALAVLAGIYISNNKARKAEDHEKRFYYKQQPISLAFEKYSHHTNYLVALLYFIDYMMLIPSDLQEQLYDTLSIAQNEKEEKKIMG